MNILWKNKKCIIGSGIATAGLLILLILLGMKIREIFLAISAVLLIITGMGLYLIGLHYDSDNSNNINLYIGKKLFEKGLEGMVIGVLVGSLSLIFN